MELKKIQKRVNIGVVDYDGPTKFNGVPDIIEVTLNTLKEKI